MTFNNNDFIKSSCFFYFGGYINLNIEFHTFWPCFGFFFFLHDFSQKNLFYNYFA